MKSYQIVEYGTPLQLAERKPPQPQGSEVLLRVHACGVCHTDVHLWDGYYDLGGGQRLEVSQFHKLPLTPGHEIVGEVVAIGSDAQDVAVGDRRIVFPWIGCGSCKACLAGHENFCPGARYIGTRVDGGYSDHVLVPHPRYLVDYSGIEETLACTFACAGITTYSALKKVASLSKDDSLVVVGAGGLGLMATQLAGTVVNTNLIVADIDDRKLEAARQVGAKNVVNSGEEGAKDHIIEMTDGGAMSVIDFVGAPSSVQFGMNVLRKGGTLVVVGLFGGAISLPLVMLPLRAMSLISSFLGTLSEMHELMALVKAGRISPIPVETRRLDQANQAISDLKAGRVVGRLVLTP